MSYSGADLLLEDVEDLAKELGHTGDEIQWTHLEDPYRRRGFHPQEIIDLFYKRGYHLMIIEMYPKLIPAKNELPVTAIKDNLNRMRKYLKNHNGILIRDRHAEVYYAGEPEDLHLVTMFLAVV